MQLPLRSAWQSRLCKGLAMIALRRVHEMDFACILYPTKACSPRQQDMSISFSDGKSWSTVMCGALVCRPSSQDMDLSRSDKRNGLP